MAALLLGPCNCPGAGMPGSEQIFELVLLEQGVEGAVGLDALDGGIEAGLELVIVLAKGHRHPFSQDLVLGAVEL